MYKKNIKAWIFKSLKREFSPLEIDIEFCWLDWEREEMGEREINVW
jgi:hypothetical protein